MLCAVALAALANGCAPAESQPSIVIVVIDTLRPDHLGLYGYEERPTSPYLDERAASAAVFERAYTTSSWTLPAFGSLFTGQLPTRHSAGVIISSLSEARETGTIGDLVSKSGTIFLRIGASLPTLAGVLEDAGYHTGAIVNNAFLSPEFGLDRGFQTYDYYAPEPDRRATEVTDLALAWLEAHDARDGAPFLLVVHYFDPHMPYEAPAPFLGRFAAQYADDQYGVPLRGVHAMRDLVRYRKPGWERYLALEAALYDEEIAYTDRELERLFAALDERGFSDDGYIFVTSDHGEEFFDHGRFEHGHSMFEVVVRVPLLVWGPGVVPGSYRLPVSLVDIMPTVLDIAGVDTDTDFEGDSIWQALAEGPVARSESIVRFDRPLVAERVLYGDSKLALIRWPWKLMVDIEDSAQLLFNLETDPGELNGFDIEDLDADGRDRLLRMLVELQAKMEEAAEYGQGEGALLSEDTLRTLRNLGYIR